MNFVFVWGHLRTASWTDYPRMSAWARLRGFVLGRDVREHEGLLYFPLLPDPAIPLFERMMS